MNNTYEKEYIATKILTVSCFCITFVLGMIGNGLVIWICGFRMKTVSAVWFLNLAIADLVFCLSLPVRIMDWLYISQNLKNGHIICGFLILFNFFMLALNSVVSVTFLTVINVHRCVSIMWPLWAKVHCTRRLAKIASVFLWVLPLTCVVLINFTFIHIDNSAIKKFFFLFIPELTYLLNMKNFYILTDHISPTLSINCVLTFLIPFIIIIICNGLIIYKLSTNRFKKPKAFFRTFRLIIAVVVCFFICWFPFNIWPLIAFKVNLFESVEDFIICNVCLCLVSISSCINPILYVLLGHTRGTKSRKSIKTRVENVINDFK
ncbi:TPA: hypothetical protein GDO54_018562 [Pyxicephalus adspersus]|uniref:G-protein coupled receptors family 1 profile domain-containing protein n=1 Tax=Pyxicephalus adspersus TaxID=30357 RepID=A0AAV2ZNL1_PYXAD|nr:TPA: hypothetical protein GDO54_018562 [Pyxicephalus adspersus]